MHRATLLLLVPLARARARGRAPRCTRMRCMVGDDSRGRARAGARHGAQERHAWLGTTRAGTRARATVHKNTMIEDDARGRHDADSRANNQKWHPVVPRSSRLVRNDQGTPRSWFLMVLAKNSWEKQWKNKFFQTGGFRTGLPDYDGTSNAPDFNVFLGFVGRPPWPV